MVSGGRSTTAWAGASGAASATGRGGEGGGAGGRGRGAGFGAGGGGTGAALACTTGTGTAPASARLLQGGTLLSACGGRAHRHPRPACNAYPLLTAVPVMARRRVDVWCSHSCGAHVVSPKRTSSSRWALSPRTPCTDATYLANAPQTASVPPPPFDPILHARLFARRTSGPRRPAPPHSRPAAGGAPVWSTPPPPPPSRPSSIVK
jgi:hypothetical protein